MGTVLEVVGKICLFNSNAYKSERKGLFLPVMASMLVLLAMEDIAKIFLNKLLQLLKCFSM